MSEAQKRSGAYYFVFQIQLCKIQHIVLENGIGNCALLYPSCILANLLPVPFVIVFLRRILSWMQRRGGKLASAACWLEHRGRAKSARIKRSELLGLYLFVAIPLPGTGAWTGALVAALLGRRLSHAMLSIGAGVTTACCIVALLCKGIINIAGL